MALHMAEFMKKLRDGSITGWKAML
jgi:hypothetical protein